MYAVIETGGKQHRVQVGEVVRVERLPVEAGAAVVFDRVLALGEGDGLKCGTVIEQGRAKKVLIFRYRARQNASRRRGGHRQDYTAVKIEAIES